MRIDVLPDEVLVTIFDYYVAPYQSIKPEVEKRISLVHVCRRWRAVVFGSPRRLNLRLFCSPRTPARDTLDVWPSLPLIIDDDASLASNEDDMVFALGHNDRIHKVSLCVAGFQGESVLTALQVPFPKATHLQLAVPPHGQVLPAVPDSFLGGSAPCMRYFSLTGIRFPGLSKFLLSTTHLVNLHLHIHRFGYIPPEAMVTCLSGLTSLKRFTLKFQFFHSYRESQRSTLAPYSVLSSLIDIEFEGSSGYLEDLVANVDAPQLKFFFVTFGLQPNLSIPQLNKFISRTPALKAPVEVHAVFERLLARVELIPQTPGLGGFHVQIPSEAPDWQLSCLMQVLQVLASSSCPVFMVENLYIEDQGSEFTTTSQVEVTQWWDFLRPFVAVKNIYLFKKIAVDVACSLEALGEGRSMEVLPALQNIFLTPPEVVPPLTLSLVQERIEQFVAVRYLLGHSITITVSNGEGSPRRVVD